jgi:hypothetical protein
MPLTIDQISETTSLLAATSYAGYGSARLEAVIQHQYPASVQYRLTWQLFDGVGEAIWNADLEALIWQYNRLVEELEELREARA